MDLFTVNLSLTDFVHVLEENQSFCNDSANSSNTSACSNVSTVIVVQSTRYPSGYSFAHILLASVIVTLLMIIVIVGNMLVIIAISTEKSLKNIQNWFIASLAVADFFLGLVIMPFSLANELMGYWTFGNWWCDVHSAMDVLLSTASIMNLCLISLDRYWSITQAVEYLKKRTPGRAAGMIAAVWLMSAVICIPPLLGWKVDRPDEPFPTCQLSKDIGYVLYSALGSFYVPSCIMVFVYIRIYFAAKARARRGIRKQMTRKKMQANVTTSFTAGAAKGTRPIPHFPTRYSASDLAQNKAKLLQTKSQISQSESQLSDSLDSSEQLHQQQEQLLLSSANPDYLNNRPVITKEQMIATIENVDSANNENQIPIVTCDLASDVSTSEANDQNTSDEYNKNTLRVCSSSVTQKSSAFMFSSKNGEAQVPQSSPQSMIRCRAPSMDVDMVSEFDPSSSDSGVVSRCAVVKPLKFRLCQPIFGRKTHHKAKIKQSDDTPQSVRQNETIDLSLETMEREDIATDSIKLGTTPTEFGLHSVPICAQPVEVIKRVQKPRDPEREKKRIARKKEKRATLILGLIMGSFIACWLPFFFLYILTPCCPSCNIPDSAFAIAFWLGYTNSALNPVIYTIFNKDFRRAFRRILFK